MKNQKLLFAFTLILSLISFQACQKSDTSNLQEAQFCLNTATADTARGCVSKIAANTTAYADSLRCSAIFISEGFSTPADFINAMNSINNPGDAGCSGGTCSSTINALVAFSFNSGDLSDPAVRSANNATAAEAFTVCSNSNVKFYAQVSSLFKIGTLATMAASLTNPSAADIEAAISGLDAATLGEIVISTSASVCTGTDENPSVQTETEKYCAELAAALASPTPGPAGIGACLKAKLADPAAVCT